MPGDAAAEALALVAAVRDDPARRLRLAGSFYDDRPGRASIRAYRRAELAFMRWQGAAGRARRAGLRPSRQRVVPWTTTRGRRLRVVLGWLTST